MSRKEPQPIQKRNYDGKNDVVSRSKNIILPPKKPLPPPPPPKAK